MSRRNETEKILDWLYGRELSWAVITLTCFIGLIELLPEVRYYGSSVSCLSLTLLIFFVALALIGGCVFAINRFVKITNVEGIVEQRLSKKMRDDLHSVVGPTQRLLYRKDNEGNLLGLKRWIMPFTSLIFAVVWTAIIILKVFQ